MLKFEAVKSSNAGKPLYVTRAKVPGGWLVLVAWKDVQGDSSSLTFVPDAKHEWNGESL